MRSRFRFTVIALGILALAVPTFLLADGTLLGTIKGRVLDESGAGVPGATVEIVSADRGFRRSLTTDATGGFTFPALQTGPYTLWATLSGFQSVEKTNNIVEPNKTTEVDVTMRLAAAAETVTVTGEVPLVDKTDTSARTTVSSTLTQKLAIGRNYQTLISNAPGVTANLGGNPNVHGAVQGANLYLFDGVDNTDVTTGTFGGNFNFEAIEEVVVSTAGVSAEYGRAQGAIVNVVSKSGTNTFSGSGKVLVNNDDWDEQNKGKSRLTGLPFAREKFDENQYRYSFTLGGPFWKDHLWFFGAYEFGDQTSAFAQTRGLEESYQQTLEIVLWDGKLTWQATPSHLFTLGANTDKIDGFVIDYWSQFGFGSAEREALTQQNQNDCGGVCNIYGRWSGVFGSNLSAEALYAENDGDIFIVPFEGHGSPYWVLAEEVIYNGATFDGSVKRPRKQANLAGNLYTQLFGDSHQFKVGVDYQDLESVASYIYPNNESFFVTGFDASARTPILSPGDFWLRFTEPASSVSTGKIYGIYALDKFEIGKNLFFNLGLRLDIQEAESDIGNTVVDTTSLSPRLTGVYDLSGNGKTLFSAAYGRYHQFIVQGLADSLYAGVAQLSNYDLFTWDGSQWTFLQEVRVGGNTNPVNSDLESSYVDEINFAAQQQLGSTMAVGLRGIYRKWYDLIDDRKFVDADGNTIIVPENFSDSELHRYYKGLELTFEKRFSRNWQAAINYTLSRTEGNTGTGLTSGAYSSQLFDYADLTCNVTSVGNLPCSVAMNVNQYGYMPYDRTHIVNVFTSYTVPLRFANVTIAPSGFWQSGLPYQAQRTGLVPDLGTTFTYMFEKRGSHRLPDYYQLNLALDLAFRPWGPLEFGVKGEVFNLTNQQQQISNTLVRLIPDANFGVATSRNAFQTPRNYRLTAFVRF
jgi:hypothetical protein